MAVWAIAPDSTDTTAAVLSELLESISQVFDDQGIDFESSNILNLRPFCHLQLSTFRRESLQTSVKWSRTIGLTNSVTSSGRAYLSGLIRMDEDVRAFNHCSFGVSDLSLKDARSSRHTSGVVQRQSHDHARQLSIP